MKDIYEMAWDLVNPDGEEASSFQEDEVLALVGFAQSVLIEYNKFILSTNSTIKVTEDMIKFVGGGHNK